MAHLNKINCSFVTYLIENKIAHKPIKHIFMGPELIL